MQTLRSGPRGRFLAPEPIAKPLLLGWLTGVLTLSALGNEFPTGSFRDLQQLPLSRLRAQIEALPPPARDRAVQWLGSFHFTEQDLPSLRVDPEGGIFYVCEIEGHLETPNELDAPPPIAAAAVPVDPFPESLIFHSRPGAPNVLYLNFTGELVKDTEWNKVVGRTEIPAVAFSSDTDLTTFSDAEQVAIKRIWQRVAEDYAPFNLNVTTERPATFNNRTAVALITRKTDANGDPNPYNTAGGVAYVNVFGTTSYAKYRPAWIYHDNLSNVESYIAEAVSHEIGHNLGLSHDGKTDGTEYYAGHGSGEISWGPIMGLGYNRNVSHWCKGDYHLANNTQDDLGIIASKASYRADDHGNTPGTATALVFTGGTNIVSTTPENDPHNHHPANKGVLERNTDVDVFSFTTGTGPVRLSVRTWVMPSGTRGGNVDILAELYNEAGNLVASDNPASQTSALIQADLSEGRYYLYVRNSGAGDPFNSSPTGYTSYGSLGQYFISGYVTEPGSLNVPPRAELQITDLTQSGQTSHHLTVTYSDDTAIDVASLDDQDLRITGSSGYDRLARFVAVDVAGDGTPRIATYAVDPPGGGVWSPSHNGTYTVWMQPEQVADTQGAWVAAGELGQFQVAVPVVLYFANMDEAPGWTLEPKWEYGIPSYGSSGPSGGFTGTRIIGYHLSGNYENNLPVKHATTPPIDVSGSSTLTLRFQRWLRTRNNDTASIQVSTNGASWIQVWSTSAAVSDASWQTVQYALPQSVAGSATLQLRWGLASHPAPQVDIGWNLDDVELLGDGFVDASPPAALLSVAHLTQAGSPSHACSVTYTDDTGVLLASLDSTDLLVTGPYGYTNGVEFVGADLPMDGSPITATYSIHAPGDVWEAADNGTYTVILLEGAVEDLVGNVTPQTVLGIFEVAIASAPGQLEITPLEGLDASGIEGGPFSPSSITYTLANIGESPLDWTAHNTESWVSLSAISGTLAAGASTPVTVSVNAEADALAAGSYTDTISFANTTSGGATALRSVTLTVSPTPGQLEISPAEELSASGTVGGPFTPSSTVYTLSNTGGSALDWTANKTESWVSLSASGGTLAVGASIPVTVSVNAEADTLAAGTYTDTISFANATSGTATALRSVTLSVSPTPGQLEVSPAEGLSSSGTVGGPFTPSSTVYTLSNTGGSALDWSANKTESWVSLSAISGTLAAGASTPVTVSVNAEADTLAAGSYTDTISFANTTSGGATALRSVTLTVSPTPGQLEVSPAEGLSASGTVGGPFTPSSTVYTLSNTGGSALDWSANKTESWVSLSAISGTLAAGASTPVTVSLNAEADTLAAGSYTDTISFANTTSGSNELTRMMALEVSPTVEFILYNLSDPGTLQLVIQGTPGMEVVLETTADLLSWSAVATSQVAADGTAVFTQPVNHELPFRWYRLRTTP